MGPTIETVISDHPILPFFERSTVRSVSQQISSNRLVLLTLVLVVPVVYPLKIECPCIVEVLPREYDIVQVTRMGISDWMA